MPALFGNLMSKAGSASKPSGWANPVTMHLQHVRAMFQLAIADRLITDSPADEVKQVKRDKPIRQTPTPQQFQSILDDITQQKFSRHAEETADFVEFLGLAGVDNGEAASLKCVDVDFAANRFSSMGTNGYRLRDSDFSASSTAPCAAPCGVRPCAG